ALPARALRDQAVDERFSRQVAAPVAGLLQVEVLLEPDELTIRTEPAARRLSAREAHGLVDRPLVGLLPQAGDRPRCALRDHDVDELAAARAVVEEPGPHRELLHRGGEALGPAVPDVVERGHAADGARMRLALEPRLVDPVDLVAAHHPRVAQ